MKKLNLLKSLILVTAVLTGTVQAFGYASTEQTVNTSVQTAVAIDKTASNEAGTIEPATGAITGEVSSSFNLKTNETNSYDFIVYSKILTTDGEVSAFDSKGNLLFGNTTSLPTSTAVSNAKSGSGANADVIGYKITMSVGDEMSINLTNLETYDECYRINFTGSVTEGTLTQSISGQPAVNTYSIGEDTSGTYSSTVYITAISK